MLYAIISDIHSNLQAFKSVLKDISTYNVDSIISLGDVVGYGPNPNEVLDLVEQHVEHNILGNHDAVISSKFSSEHFNEDAEIVIRWTAQELGVRGFEFFQDLPLTLANDEFECSHAEFKNPISFNYITTPEQAVVNFCASQKNLMFVGHSHYPGLYLTGKSGKVYWLPLTEIGDGFNIEPGKRYIVNVGSVGDPRDGDLRASYVLYDDERNRVIFKRVSFDYDALQREYKRKQLPEEASFSLQTYLKKKVSQTSKYSYLKDMIK
jgi:predicted phosphodiesterase